MRMFAPVRLLPVACAGALVACSPSAGDTEGADPPPAQPATELAQKPDNCLLVVWQDQPARDERFDLANDSADGGAISCATGTSASQFASAFAAIRSAARSEDKAAILDEVGLPLMYIDTEGERRELTDPGDVDAAFAEVFDEDVLALLRDIDLDALTVVPDQGAFVQLGSVWLVVDRNGGRPRIVTVNRQALGEAAAAAREEAQGGGGQEIRLDKQRGRQNNR